MDVRWIEDFLSLVETRNFSLAAEKRCVTQSAYSKRIRALENWLGVELFDRSTLPIKVTDRGQEFLPYAEELIAGVSRIHQAFPTQKGTVKNEIRIATLHALMLHFMPQLLGDFDFKGTKLVVSSNLVGFDTYVTDIVSGNSDLLICYEVPQLEEKLKNHSAIENAVIGTEDIVPVMAAELENTVNWETSGKIPCLVLTHGSFIAAIVEQKISGFRDKLETVYEANMSESLLHMAKQGRGVAWLPRSVCEKDLKKRKLVILEGPNLAIKSSIKAYISRQKATPITSAFFRSLQQLH